MNLGTRPGVALLTAVRETGGPCLAPPEGELHGLAAPDWRGEIRMGHTSTSTLTQRSRVDFESLQFIEFLSLSLS